MFGSQQIMQEHQSQDCATWMLKESHANLFSKPFMEFLGEKN